MKSQLLKKLIAYGFFPLSIVFFTISPVLGFHTASAWCENGECIGTFFSVITVALNALLSLLLYLVGTLLDFTITFSITPIGDLYRSETVSVAWNLLRDIINMSFIFILLYVAIGTVLNISNVDWKKQLSAIIIAAILVNFSLFITRVVIDAGNILANSFYTEITACDPPCNGRDSIGISEKFMGALQIAKIGSIQEAVTAEDAKGWGGFATSVVKLMTTIVAIWVFLSAAILFITRTFALMFILILSPIGVAGAGLPLLSTYAKRWREELFKQSMLGVVFLFFVFIVLVFAQSERSAIMDPNNNISLGADQATIDSTIGTFGDDGTGAPQQRPELVLIMYVLVIAALIMALRLTKSMSGEIGKFGDNLAKTAVGVGLGVAAGGTALAMRASVGGAASRTLANEDLKARAREGDRGAQRRLDLASNLEKSSFDPRQTSLGKSATGKLEKLGLKGVKTTQKAGRGGYRAGMERDTKAAVEKSKRYAPSEEWVNKQADYDEKRYDYRQRVADRLQKEAESMPPGSSEREKKMASAQEYREAAESYKKEGIAKSKTVAAAEQMKFAKSLEKETWWTKARSKPIIALSARNMRRRQKQQADAIRKEVNKKDFDKLLEVVKKTAEDGKKEEE